MDPLFFGDSYDIVKRFFCGELAALGYEVVADPMFTGDWGESQRHFFNFIKSKPLAEASQPSRRALFLDPNTGVNGKGSMRHVSIDRLAREAAGYEIVFSFDQSFSRQFKPGEVMASKLSALQEHGCHGMYYDSHARFIFLSRTARSLGEVHAHLVSLGLPAKRLLRSGT